MKKEERIALISSITHNQVFGEGRRLRYKGETKEFKIFEIPMEALIYNVQNGRIGSLVKTFEHSYGVLDPENLEDSLTIAKMLYSSNEPANKKTRADIAKCGQMEAGIITADGILVDGNRRASLMWSILNDPDADPNEKARCERFRTVVLPENATQKDILRLETTYQLGTDEKVGYNAIEKYLHARDMEEKGFSIGEIEEYMGETNSSVQELLEVATLIDDYLDNCDCVGLYTRLPKGFEDDLLKLNTAIKKIRKGSISWIPTTRLNKVETDLKAVCFDYIRLNMKKEDGFEFRDILQTSGGNFLQNEDVWNDFVENWQNAVDEVEEESIDAIIDRASGDDLERELNKRDNQWREKVKDSMKDAFKNAKDIIDNQREKEKPNALLRKVINALNGVDLETVYRMTDKTELKEQMKEITRLLEDVNSAIAGNNN